MLETLSPVRASLAAILCLCAALAGCSNPKDFDAEKAKSIIEASPVNLDGEQVSLTSAQLDCGVKAELWESPSQVSQDRSTARLSQSGRAIKFNDDVVIEPKYRQPYVQIRGAVPLQVDITNIRDGETNGTKIVETKAGAKIEHMCFPNPIPIMGVKKGEFQPDVPVSFEFRLDNDGWKMERLVH